MRHNGNDWRCSSGGGELFLAAGDAAMKGLKHDKRCYQRGVARKSKANTSKWGATNARIVLQSGCCYLEITVIKILRRFGVKSWWRSVCELRGGGKSVITYRPESGG
jgi:hypothetical protein